MSDIGFEYGEEGKKMLQLLLKFWKIILMVICTEVFEKKNAFPMLSKIEKLTSINRMGKFWSEAKKELNVDLRNWLNYSWKLITEARGSA